jgi:hypothetical protein
VGAFNPAIHAPVTPGLTYTTSIGYRLVSGTAPIGALIIRGKQCNSAGSFIGGTGANLGAVTSTLQRGAAIEVAVANAAFIQPNIYMSVNNGQAVNATIRFYTANVELGTGNARPLLQRNVPETVAAIGELDAEALLTFVGGSDGFITILHDKSGNGRNATQTPPDSQPRIVINGAIVTQNGRPMPRFNGLNTFFNGIPLPLSQFTLMAVLNDATLSGTIRYPIGTGSTSAGRGVFSSFQSNPNKSLGFTTDTQPGVVQTGFLPTIGQSYVVSLTTNATESSIWANGGNNATGGKITLNELFVGQRGDNQWHYDGNSSGNIVFPSALSTTERQILERSRGAYYGITVA